MQSLSSEELQFHYLSKMNHIEEEMRTCYGLIKTLEKIIEGSRKGHCAHLMKTRLEDMERQQLRIISDLDGLISNLGNIL